MQIKVCCAQPLRRGRFVRGGINVCMSPMKGKITFFPHITQPEVHWSPFPLPSPNFTCGQPSPWVQGVIKVLWLLRTSSGLWFSADRALGL